MDEDTTKRELIFRSIYRNRNCPMGKNQSYRITHAAENAKKGMSTTDVVLQEWEPQKHLTAHRSKQYESRQRSQPLVVE